MTARRNARVINVVEVRSAGRIEIDNNAAERAIRAIALGRNWLFASDVGGETAAAGSTR